MGPQNNYVAPGVSMAPVGLYYTGLGWSAVLSNPNLATKWGFFESPITGLSGPSTRLSDALAVNRIGSIEFPGAPDGSYTLSEGFSRGYNRGQINNFNGAAGESVLNDVFAGNRPTLASETFTNPATGNRLTQIDGITNDLHWWDGPSVLNLESKVGFSDAIRQANFDSQYFGLPASYTDSLGIGGIDSNSGLSRLITGDDVAGIASDRFYGQLTRGAGLTIGTGGLVLDTVGGLRAAAADDYQFGPNLTAYSLQTAPTYAGIGYGFYTGSAGAATLGEAIALGSSNAGKFGLGGAAVGLTLGQGYAYYADGGQFGPNSWQTLENNAWGLGVAGGSYVAGGFAASALGYSFAAGGPIGLGIATVGLAGYALYDWYNTPSSPWDSISFSDAINASSFDFASAESASQIAGIGWNIIGDTGSGGFTSAAVYDFTPGQTSNSIFDDSWLTSYTPTYDYGGNGYSDYDVSSYFGSSSYDYDYSSFDWSNQSFDYGSGFDYDGYGFPVVLDLDGTGLNITPQSSSNFFYDMAGDGYKHRTAWAGAGNGVLVLDVAGTGQITERNQVIFTDWDPTATSDMQALANVFDTNHDGRLDAGDAEFASFKIMVTNADGTTTLKTLAEAGVQSIDLTLSGAANDNAPTGGAVAA